MKKLLVVVDMQNDFISGALGTDADDATPARDEPPQRTHVRGGSAEALLRPLEPDEIDTRT